MIKSLIKFLIFLAVLCGIGYLAFHPLLNWFSHRAINYAIGRLQSPNLTLSNPSFKNARMGSPKAVTCENFTITAMVVPPDSSRRAFRAIVNAETLTLEAKEFFNGLFIISARGLRISQDYLSQDASSAHGDTPGVLQEGNATVLLKLEMTNLADIKMQVRNFAAEIKKLTEEAKTALPVDISAKAIYKIEGNAFAVKLQTEKKGAVYCLVANRDDVKFVGEKIFPASQALTAADVDIIANNPIRAPQLLRIQSKASTVASDAYAQNRKVPEHVYKHVLWSYLLTKEYGADFAKQVTDAHEIVVNPEESTDPGAGMHHGQDVNNSKVGRQYAALGYGESDILSLVMTDPQVIR